MNIKSTQTYKLLSYLYHYALQRHLPPKFNDLQACMRIIAEEKKDVFFIQVGSNDGVQGDPIYPYIKNNNWKGICIEPITETFRQLADTHRNTSGVHLEHAAVGEDGQMTIYKLDPQKAEQYNVTIPSYYSQLASFEKKYALAFTSHPHEERILSEEQVQSISFSTLIKKYNINKLDLLHIDVEGGDWMVLKTFCFDKITPSFIIYEQLHLSKEVKLQSLLFLRKKGYRILWIDLDMFAYQKQYDPLFKEIRSKSKAF